MGCCGNCGKGATQNAHSGWKESGPGQASVSVLSPSPRVPTVLQVPRGWLVKGALLVCLDSVVREDSLAFLAHR